MCAKTQKIDNVCSPSKRDFLSWQMSGFQLDKCKEESKVLIKFFLLRTIGLGLIFFQSDYSFPVDCVMDQVSYHSRLIVSTIQQPNMDVSWQ